MIYELTYDRVFSTHMQAFLGHCEAAAKLRDGRCGELLGAWTSDIGELNQVVQLWRHEAGEDPLAGFAELRRSSAWRRTFAEPTSGMIISQQRRFLKAASPVELQPKGENALFELRQYSTVPGKGIEAAQLLADYLPLRRQFSPNVGTWAVEGPDPDAVVHLWAYRDFQQRLDVRSQKDPRWREIQQQVKDYTAKMRAYLTVQTSTLLLPCAFSPM